MKTYYSYIQESEKILTPVCLFIGRFQPFHYGHLNSIIQGSQLSGTKIILCRSSSRKNKKSVFSNELIQKMLYDVSKEYSQYIENVVTYSGSPYFTKGDLASKLSNLYVKPFSMVCGIDRAQTFYPMTEIMKRNNELSKHFKVHVVERQQGFYSSTFLKQCLLSNNRVMYKKLTPDVLHPYFEELRKELIKSDYDPDEE